MKHLILNILIVISTLFVFMIAPAYGYDAKAIYESMMVVETTLSSGTSGLIKTEKTAGNMTCVKSLKIEANTTSSYYDCEMFNDDFLAFDIYDSIDATEKYLNPGAAGIYVIQKSVGGLVCVKSRMATDDDTQETFACILN